MGYYVDRLEYATADETGTETVERAWDAHEKDDKREYWQRRAYSLFIAVFSRFEPSVPFILEYGQDALTKAAYWWLKKQGHQVGKS